MAYKEQVLSLPTAEFAAHRGQKFMLKQANQLGMKLEQEKWTSSGFHVNVHPTVSPLWRHRTQQPVHSLRINIHNKQYSLYTYCWSSAFQLSVASIDHCALLTADHNCGVLTEAETSQCQQRASYEKKNRTEEN